MKLIDGVRTKQLKVIPDERGFLMEMAAIHEALFFSKPIREIILSSGEKIDENAIREQAIKDGTWSLRRAGMERMKAGTTSLEEIVATRVEDES